MAEYLDRESVLVILDSFLKAHEEILDAPPQCNLVYHAMRKLPAADVAPVVHGRWIVENEESIRCSECCFNRASIKMPLNYCPICGAKMGGGNEDA